MNETIVALETQISFDCFLIHFFGVYVWQPRNNRPETLVNVLNAVDFQTDFLAADFVGSEVPH